MDAWRRRLQLVCLLFWGLSPVARAGVWVSRLEPGDGLEGVDRDAPVIVELAGDDAGANPLWTSLRVNGERVHPEVRESAGGLELRYRVPDGWPEYGWAEVSGVSWGLGITAERVAWRSRFRAGGWPRGEMPAELQGGVLDGVDAALGPDGRVHLGLVRDQALLYAVEGPEGWEVQVIDPEGVYKAPRIAVSPEGAVHLLWFYADERHQWLRYSSSWSGAFSEPYQVHVWMFPYSRSRPYDLALDAGGTAHLLWQEEADPEGLLWHTRFSRDLGELPRVVCSVPNQELEPRLVVVDGVLRLAAWVRKPGNYGWIEYALWNPERGEFQDPSALPHGPLENVRGLSGLGFADRVLLFWEERDGFSGPFRLEAAAVDASGRADVWTVETSDRPFSTLSAACGGRLRLVQVFADGVRSGFLDQDGRRRAEWVRRRGLAGADLVMQAGHPALWVWIGEDGELGLRRIPGCGDPPRVLAGGYREYGPWLIVTALVRDPDRDLSEVLLLPQGGGPPRSMFDDGLHGDGAAGDGIYALPVLQFGGVADLGRAPRIEARDRAGNRSAPWPGLLSRPAAGAAGP
jgi:hypothetical protein